jgi:DNA-binding transcriptional LysR family regulator
MIDSLRDLTVFTRVIDVGSLSAASRELNMSLAVVSKRLARLESRLGVRLINRTTRNLGMTDEGKEFYKCCVRILADIMDAEDSVGSRKNRASGLLRATATAAFARWQLRRLVPLFLQRTFALSLRSPMQSSIARSLRAEQLMRKPRPSGSSVTAASVVSSVGV